VPPLRRAARPAFPRYCPVCGYSVADRQVMDMAMEFEGERHLGPSKPIAEYMEEQELRVEKRKFIRQVLDGGQGKVPKEWLTDKELLEDLTPQEMVRDRSASRMRRTHPERLTKRQRQRRGRAKESRRGQSSHHEGRRRP
jgi:hypothetical protein